MGFLLSIFEGLYVVFGDVRVRGLLAFALSLIAVAIFVFRLLEDWTLPEAAFFSVVTISAVDYGELVPQTVAGKMFCMVYILPGLGVFAAAASAVAEALIGRRQDRAQK